MEKPLFTKPLFQEQPPLLDCIPDPRPRRAKPLAAEYEALARTRLSKNFILREFLFSTQAASLGLSNFPERPSLVISAARTLCEKVLEPVLAQFGRFVITFGYQCREAIEAGMPPAARSNPRSSSPHQFDRCTFGEDDYARVDILPFCVEDGEIDRRDFGHWMMMNLDIDLVMQWKSSNVYCITISPRPRRVWLEWGSRKRGEPQQEVLMGTDFWQHQFPQLKPHERPRFGPSCTGGELQWRRTP